MGSDQHDAPSPPVTDHVTPERAPGAGPSGVPLMARGRGMAGASAAMVLLAGGWVVVARVAGFSPPPQAIDRVISFGGAAAALVAAAMVVRAAATRTGRARMGWGAIGLGAALLALGTIDLAAGATPMLGEVGGRGANPLQLVGIAVMTVGAAAMPTSIRWTPVSRIDTALVVLAGMSLLWLAPLRSATGTAGGLTEVLALEPWAGVTAVLILLGAAMLVRCAPGRRLEMRPLIVAVLAYPASIYTALVGLGRYGGAAASLVSQLWWLVGPVFLAGAGARAWSTWREPASSSTLAARFHATLPAVAVVTTLACVGVHQRVMSGLDPVMMSIGVLTVLLAAARLSLLQSQQVQLLDDLHLLAGELGDQARRDELTGLGNRLALEERLDRSLRRGPDAGVSVFFIDIDNFKNVNDALGHDAGDRLLVEMSLRLTDVLGSGVFRIGGDEFVAVRDDLDDGRAEVMAAALVAALSPPVMLDGRPVSAASSVGLARSTRRPQGDGPDRRADDPDALLRRADLALYRAKELGRSRWAGYDTWLQDRADRRLSLQQGLRRALAHDEFDVRYQPVVDLATRRVVGAEAVLRWDTPDHGLLLPDEFLPLAAEAGLLPDIGRVVLRTVTDRLDGAVLVGGDPLWIAVNVSAQEMAHVGLVREVGGALRAHGVDPGRLHLEVTERLVMDPAAGNALDQLASLGVGLTVQDFGTGSASWRQLRRFPDPTIKVDRSFVAGLGRRRDDRLILEAVAELASDLGFTLAADGVSQEVQAAELLHLGATYAQGWLFGRAVAWDEFATEHLVHDHDAALGSGA